MPTSVYFNNQNASREQMLLEDMVIESIKNHGIDVYYLPRTSQSVLDSLFGDDPVKFLSFFGCNEGDPFRIDLGFCGD